MNMVVTGADSTGSPVIEDANIVAETRQSSASQPVISAEDFAKSVDIIEIVSGDYETVDSGFYAITTTGFCQFPALLETYTLTDSLAVNSFVGTNYSLITTLNDFYKFVSQTYGVSEITLDFFEDPESDLKSIVVTPNYGVESPELAMAITDSIYNAFFTNKSAEVRSKITLSF
ncbi:MAG: hypothetical protein MRY76_10435 [Pseudomonadales bacterium]|nr:hypothetical protein [Pseudomonadales bacterium]